MGGTRGGATRVIRALLAGALLAAAGASAQPTFTVEALMQRLAATGDSAVAFTETRHSSALKTPLVTAGEMRYARPAHLERRVTTPFEERYVVDGDRVTIEREGATARTLSLAGTPALAAFLESIRATLQGDLATLRRFYRVELEGAPSGWTLALLPSDPAMAEFVSVIRISGAAGRVTGMEVVETGGDRVVTRFAEVGR
jgi:outer membrane lipoprotein-sorting protein